MSLRTASRPRLELDVPTRMLLESVAAEPRAPLRLTIQAPGGYGKTAVLRELDRIYRAAGVPVLNDVPAAADRVDPEVVLLVDEAHLLESPVLRRLREVAQARQRLVVAYRPWPRPAALLEVAAVIRRDRPPHPLPPFTADRIASYLTGTFGVAPHPSLVQLLYAQTGGVPGLVDRLARALAAQGDLALDGMADPVAWLPPESVLYQFQADLDELDPDVRRFLLAGVADVGLDLDLLGSLLGRRGSDMDGVLAAARATGLLGNDDAPLPVVRHALAALTPAAQRADVWQRLAGLQLERGRPVLPVVRSLRDTAAAGDSAAAAFDAAGDEALVEEPGLAAELFATATAAGRAAAARQALALALSGDLDSALRVADRLVAGADPVDRAEGATVVATALAHRGQLGRSAELYRWSGTSSAVAFAAVGLIATGALADAEQVLALPSAGEPPTLLGGAAAQMARGVHESVTGSAAAALSTLVQAATLLEPAGRAALLPDSPAALAALVALHCGELDIAESVVDRALATRMGGPLMSTRHRLIAGWLLMTRGKTQAARDRLAGAAPREPRDLLFAAGLAVGIARRDSDLTEMRRAWGDACDAVMRHPVDLFTLLPLGELTIAAARLGEAGRLPPYHQAAHLLLDRLGNPPLWTVPLLWSGLHAAIVSEHRPVAEQHAAALAAHARHSRYAAALAAAAETWLDVHAGRVDPVRVENVARALHANGLCWDGARLAGQAAIRTADRRAMTTLLDCARMLAGRPARAEESAHAAEQRLSEREQEVADLVLAGLTYKQIGDRLFISAKTVEHHVARIRQRLGCTSRSDLLARLRLLAAERSRGFPPPRQRRSSS